MVGGVASMYHLLPFLVEIFLDKPDQSPYHLCGGSLITYQWVLTAGHCCYPLLKNVNIYVGAGRIDNTYINLNHGIKFQFGQTRRVNAFYRHEQFVAARNLNDIALLKVRQPFTETAMVSLATLPDERSFIDLTELYKRCHVGGWGNMSPDIIQIYDPVKKKWIFNRAYVRTHTMHFAVVPLISNKQCRRLSNFDTEIFFDVQYSEICALYYPGRKSVCQGDSGGPLICGTKQEGIVSWSFSCGKPRLGAQVFVRVDQYVNWINQTITKYSSNPPTKLRSLDTDYYQDYRSSQISQEYNIIIILFALMTNLINNVI